MPMSTAAETYRIPVLEERVRALEAVHLGPLFAEAALDAVSKQRAARRRLSLGGTPVHIVSVALGTRGKAFGALVASRRSHSFNDDDIHVVELLGHSAAVAIANAR